MTASDLAKLPEGIFVYELDEGELIRMAPAGEEHGWVESHLFGLLFEQVRKRNLGVLYTSDTGFVLRTGPDVVRSPDIAFVRRERLPLPVDKSGYILGAPDLAVEIRSASQPPADLDKKLGQYLAAGTQVVWVVEPNRRRAVLHKAETTQREITEDQLLEDAKLLPGVRILLRDAFKPR